MSQSARPPDDMALRCEFDRVLDYLHEHGISFSKTDPEDGRQDAVYYGGHTLKRLRHVYAHGDGPWWVASDGRGSLYVVGNENADLACYGPYRTREQADARAIQGGIG